MVVKLIPLINLYSFNRSPIYCFWMLEALGVLLVYLTFRLIGIGEIGGRPYLSEKDTHQTDSGDGGDGGGGDEKTKRRKSEKMKMRKDENAKRQKAKNKRPKRNNKGKKAKRKKRPKMILTENEKR